MQQYTLGESAQQVDGQLAGPADLVIRAAKILREAGPGEITLADRQRLAQQAEHSGASAVITNGSVEPPRIPHIVVGDVSAAFATVVELFRPPSQERVEGISPAAHVSPTARIAAGVRIGPGASIGEHVEIGENTVIHASAHVMAGCRIGRETIVFPQVVLYEDTQVGDRVILHGGAVIGAFGFGYRTVDGRHQLSAQLGNVEIHDDVEIGANTTIDRGTYGPTVIEEGTKIDNLVMIAHNCHIGRHNLLCSQVGVAGSSTTGKYVVMAGQVGVRDHVEIGDMTQIGAQGGVGGDLEAGLAVVGTPARPERVVLQEVAMVRRMPEMRRRLRDLERQVQQLLGAQNGAAEAAASDGAGSDGGDSSGVDSGGEPREPHAA